MTVASDQTEIKARFDAWVEDRVVIPEDDEMPPGEELSEEDRSLREDQKRWDKEAVKGFEQLQFCADPMPLRICEELDLPPGSTYAQGYSLIRVDHPRPPWLRRVK